MDTPPFIDPLARIVAPQAADSQPPLIGPEAPGRLYAALGSLALGGAERIVLDWTSRMAPRQAVTIAVLRDAEPGWAVPPGVEIVRLHDEDVEARLETFARRAARAQAGSGAPIVCCHLLSSRQRAALRSGGALTVPVLHNAASGWLEPAEALQDDHFVLAVSQAAAAEYRAAGGRVPCIVTRHFPRKASPDCGARARWRTRWALPADAWVIGMVGAVKPQKAYTRALRILREILDGDPARGAYLVIVGGPTGRDGDVAWNALLAQALRLGVEDRVRLAGFVGGAWECLPAFDVFLNTSRFEGLSIATLEALAAGVPVVASRVGGQGEAGSKSMTLLPFDAPDAQWAGALIEPTPAARPAWLGFPSERGWSLAHRVRPFVPSNCPRVLFVTANLNTGGAQRSLVNLSLALRGRVDFEIAVTGPSSASAFSTQLANAGIRHFRSAASRDCLDHAEALIAYIGATGPSCVCFWNVDAKIKLLLVKWLGHGELRFIDVSPGDFLFEEMEAARAFQHCVAFGEEEYFERLDALVQKYAAPSRPGTQRKTVVIPNGVALVGAAGCRDPRTSRVALCGRIAPTKFVLEALAALRVLWESMPLAELHVLGTAEARDQDYAMQVVSAAGAEAAAGGRLFFHGPVFGAPEELGKYDALLVLGYHQGCPNSVLEALAAGVPVVANDSGGTRELVRQGKTGLLLDSIEPSAIAAALHRVLCDASLAGRLAKNGRKLAGRRYSMDRMCDAYLRVLC